METELRQVTIEEYWPLIVKNTAEFGQIAVAENPEFNYLASCIYRVLKDSFIDADMTEYGVSRWEKILKLVPAETDTLDDRKARILYYLSVKLPYTWRVLKQMLTDYIGDAFVMEYINDEGKVVIHTDRISDDKLQTIKVLLDNVLPKNIEVVRYNHYIGLSWRGLNTLEDIMGDVDFLHEYVEEENKLVIHTDRANDEQLEQIDDLLTTELLEDVHVVKYNFNMEVSWRNVDKYAHCKNQADMLAVNPDYKNDLTSDGTWVYNLTSLENGLYVFKSNSKLKRFSDNVTFSALTRAGGDWPNAMCHGAGLTELHKNMNFCNMTTGVCFVAWTKLTEVKYDLGLVSATNLRAAFEGTKIKSFTSVLPKVKIAQCLFNNVPNLEEFNSELPSASDCYMAFNKCKLNKASALRVLNSVPAYTSGTHELGIGIHIDHQNDDEVLAAIANAEAKGWTLTVQWNGTPTSGISTTDLEEIYAKVTESEYGEYTDENGNRCVLDWGHYVTDTTEYKLFYSLVEAEQYFKLNKIEVTENE